MLITKDVTSHLTDYEPMKVLERVDGVDRVVPTVFFKCVITYTK